MEGTPKKRQRISTQIHTRELDRAVAKANMKKGGLRKFCKGKFFSENWRDFADPVAYKKKRLAEKAAIEEAKAKAEANPTADAPAAD